MCILAENTVIQIFVDQRQFIKVSHLLLREDQTVLVKKSFFRQRKIPTVTRDGLYIHIKSVSSKNTEVFKICYTTSLDDNPAIDHLEWKKERKQNADFLQTKLNRSEDTVGTRVAWKREGERPNNLEPSNISVTSERGKHLRNSSNAKHSAAQSTMPVNIVAH